MTFYDLHGKAIAYLHNDGVNIYLFSGKPVAYLYNNAVYGFNGHHLGWFENGWIRDIRGNCVFFTENASGGPVRPARCAKPAKCTRYARPAKYARHARYARAAKTLSWSQLSGELFFNQ